MKVCKKLLVILLGGFLISTTTNAETFSINVNGLTTESDVITSTVWFNVSSDFTINSGADMGAAFTTSGTFLWNEAADKIDIGGSGPDNKVYKLDAYDMNWLMDFYPFTLARWCYVNL